MKPIEPLGESFRSPRSPVSQKLAEFVSENLEKHATVLVEAWIDWVQSRIGTRTVNALPRKAIENHIPPVVVALARYVRSPLHAVHTEILGHLQLHGQIRRDQGYELQELLAEFDGLAHLLGAAVVQWLNQLDDEPSLADALDVHGRLTTGLRAIALVTVGTYRDAENMNRQELARRLEEFARAVTHELRNPLNALGLGIRLLRDDNVATDSAQRNEHLSVMESALERTTDLIQDIRVLALAEGAQARDQLSNLRLSAQTVIDELRNAAAADDVQVAIDGELPDVDVDGVVVELALVNVIGNSIKFHDPDKDDRSVHVSAELVEHEDQTSQVHIRVSDNGIGIPADLVSRVFKRHFRAAPERADGTGLGLAITQQVLTENGGSIDIESVEGEGTTVTIRVRALEASYEHSAAGDERPEELMRRSIEAVVEEEEADGEDSATPN